MDLFLAEFPKYTPKRAAQYADMLIKREEIMHKLEMSIGVAQRLSLLTKTPYVRTSIEHRQMQMKRSSQI
jgi:hypothetical protein